MKILAIETSCDIASVAILEDNNLILELKETSPKNHSEALMPLIDRLLNSANCTLDDIDLFAVDNRSSALLQVFELGCLQLKHLQM